jgi:purine-binding chemotaxis protein CheW
MIATATNKYIEIGVGQELHALKITDLSEIIKMQNITRIPNGDGTTLGIINLRGNIVPIVSLSSKLGLSAQDYTKATRIIVVNYSEGQIGLVVDSVNRVVTFDEIKPTPPSMGEINISIFEGIGQTDQLIVTIISIENLLRL